MATSSAIDVTGMKGGSVGTIVAAHTIERGVANSGPQYKAKKISNTNIEKCQGVTTVGDVNGHEVNITNKGQGVGGALSSTEQSNPKSIHDYTVKDIEDLLKKESFPDDVIKKFVENGIDGKYFKNLNTDAVLEELAVSSPLQKMEIKTLIATFS